MSDTNNKQRRKFGLLVSVTFSLMMNLVFLTAYNQPFNLLNWMMQLPLTIPAGAIVGISVSLLLARYAPGLAKPLKDFAFCVLMSVVMSIIMVPFALIPRVGFDIVILLKAMLAGVPVGIVVAYLVVPFCHWLVFKSYSMPDFQARQS